MCACACVCVYVCVGMCVTGAFLHRDLGPRAPDSVGLQGEAVAVAQTEAGHPVGAVGGGQREGLARGRV